MKIGIIGFGQLGQFAAFHLARHFEVLCFDCIDKSKEAGENGVRFTALAKAAAADAVIMAVPISRFQEVLAEVVLHLRKGAILFDVCSVKMKPAETMLRLVPDYVDLVATHPLFGPKSAANGLKGHRIVVCPLRTVRLAKIKDFLERLGLEVIVASPEEHDRQMAKTQGLAQFIGRVLINMDCSQHEITVPSFSNLLRLKDTLKDDSFQLFLDIQRENPFVWPEIDRFRDEFLGLMDDVRDGERPIS